VGSTQQTHHSQYKARLNTWRGGIGSTRSRRWLYIQEVRGRFILYCALPYQCQYEWGGRKRRPLNRDHILISCASFLLYSASSPVPLTSVLCSELSSGLNCRVK
jgi:hypothetical protein